MDDEMTRIVEDDVLPLKFFDRIAGIFFSPGKVMKNIKEYPKAGAAVIAVLILAAVSCLYLTDVSRIQLEEQSMVYVERYGADFADIGSMFQAGSDNATLLAVSTIGGALVSPFITAFITALVLLIITKIARGTARIGQYYSMYFHIYIVTYLFALIPLFFIVFNQASLNVLSLAIFMPNGNITSPVYNILSVVTVISVWEAVLVFIGVKEINAWKNGRSFAAAAVMYVLTVAVNGLMPTISLMVMDWSFNMVNSISF